MSTRNFIIFGSALCLLSCRSDVRGPVGPPEPPPLDPRALLLWRDSSTAGQIRPVVDDSVVYLYSFAHVASAVGKASGGLRWKQVMPVTDPSRFGSGLQLVNGVLVIGDRDLFGVDPMTGALRWQYRPSVGAIPGFVTQTSDNRTVYCGSTTRHVFAVDAQSGAERWVTQLAKSPANIGVYRPIFADGVVYAAYTIFTNPRGTTGVAALDAVSGTILWNRLLPNIGVDSSSGTTAGVSIVGAYVVAPSGDGRVYGLSRITGEIVQTLPYSVFDPVPPTNGGGLGVVRSHDGRAFLATLSGRVTALDADLRRLWSVQLGLGSSLDVATDSDFVYVTHGGGQLAVLRIGDGSRFWTMDRGTFRADGQEGIGYAPAIDGERLYAGGEFEVYAFKRR